MQQKDLKICIAGVGGVGGFLAAMLNKNHADQLTLIARGKRKEHLLTNGLTIHSQMLGEVESGVFKHVIEGTEAKEKQDIIFICVKNYSLKEICEMIRPMVKEDTILIPIMNGVEASDVVRSIFPEAISVAGLIYCNLSALADYSIEHRGNYIRVFVGSKTGDERSVEAAKLVHEILAETDIESHYSENIEASIWKKYILNCAFNTITARYNMPSGELREDSEKVHDFEMLLTEAYDVAVKAGIPVEEGTVAEHLQFFLEKQAYNATSSLRGDLWAGKNIELDAFTGALIRKAEEVSVSVPKAREYHAAILQIYQELHSKV